MSKYILPLPTGPPKSPLSVLPKRGNATKSAAEALTPMNRAKRLKSTVEQLINPLHFAHTNGRCHVLRLDMESRRNGFADLITVINRFLLYTKWNKNMHDIRPIASGMHDAFIVISKTEIVLVA